MSESASNSSAINPHRVRSIIRWLWRQYDSIAKRTLAPLARLLQRCGWNYRFVNFYGERIGHLALEPDLFIKEGRLGLRPLFKEIWLAPPDKIANQHLLRYWERHLRTVQSPLLARLLLPLAKQANLGFDVTRFAVAIDGTALYPAIQSAWDGRPPLLRLTQPDQERGSVVLQKLGIPEGAWFVCVHNREIGFSPSDASLHAYRDSEITSYFSAMEAVVERGGWCIRMGDKSMKPLPPMPQVIDYARHEAKSEWMDIFLCATCKCFLGSSSGLALVATIFGVPAARAHQSPVSGVLPVGNRDLGIPKLLWSTHENRLLTFAEVLDSPAGSFRFTHLYEQAGLKLIDNSPDEIRELALELLEVAEGSAQYSLEDELLQQKFKSLMRPGHYSYGAKSRVGRYFLRKHAALLSGKAEGSGEMPKAKG